MYQGGRGGPQVHGTFDADEDEALGKVYNSRVIKRLPKYLGPVKLWVALGAGGMMVRTLAALALPYLVGIATDKFIQAGNLSGLNIIAVAFVGVGLLVWAGQYLETLFLSYAGQAILYRMRTEMFAHLQRLSLSFFDRSKVGKLMSRVQNDVQQVQELLTSDVLNAVTSVLTLIGIAGVMIVMDVRLALLTLTVVPVLGVVIVIWQKYARRAFIRVRRAIAMVNAQLQEGISGIRVTQSLSREEINLRQFDGINEIHQKANINAAKLQSLMMPLVEILTGVAYSLVIVFGGYQVLAGEMGPGVLIAFLLYIQRFFNPVLELTMLYTELQRAMASGSRIFELLDIEPEIKDSPQAIEMPLVKGELKLQQVSFSYQSGVEILHDIDLAIRAGETVAIVGRTGAGKSSLVNIITRFYEVDKGAVIIDGYNVRSVTQQSLRRQIGIVLQDPFLFSGSIADNIRYGHIDATYQELIEAAQIAGAHDFITHLDHGYDTLVGERGSNLSAGQRQFICLARAILANPPILILDEATSNIDTNAERLMQKSLHSLIKGRTCIIIAHRLSTITNADRIIVLEKGKIVESGSHQELLDKQGLYYHMCEAISTFTKNNMFNL
ncbi:MAG: ABC transporter ATP-binding protein [Dehalococcoidales bacterium]|nr:ABC transporter ATP-binding protein [Dehalococcoidales bacterium]